MSRSKEFFRYIPNFNLTPDLGGSLVNETNRDNEISYEAITSKKAVDFALINEGFRALFYGLGVGVKYNSEGDLEAVRINTLPFLKYLLEKDETSELSDTAITDYLDLAALMENSQEEYVAHLDLSEKQFYFCGINRNDKDNTKIYASKKIKNLDAMTHLEVGLGDLTFYMFIGQFEEGFGIGLAMFEYENEENEEINNLFRNRDDDKEDLDVSMLTLFLANDCNYMTYLDSKKANRFEKLAQRIILG